MNNQIEIYQTVDNQTEIKVVFENETVWLNRQQLAGLFNSVTDGLKQYYS